MKLHFLRFYHILYRYCYGKQVCTVLLASALGLLVPRFLLQFKVSGRKPICAQISNVIFTPNNNLNTSFDILVKIKRKLKVMRVQLQL